MTTQRYCLATEGASVHWRRTINDSPWACTDDEVFVFIKNVNDAIFFSGIIRHSLIYGQTKIPSKDTDISNVIPERNMKSMVEVSK